MPRRLPAIAATGMAALIGSCSTTHVPSYTDRLRDLEGCRTDFGIECMSVADEATLKGVPIAALSHALGRPDYCVENGRRITAVQQTCPSGMTWGWLGSEPLQTENAPGPALRYECAVESQARCVLRVLKVD